jgi:hypothetical protein
MRVRPSSLICCAARRHVVSAVVAGRRGINGRFRQAFAMPRLSLAKSRDTTARMAGLRRRHYAGRNALADPADEPWVIVMPRRPVCVGYLFSSQARVGGCVGLI